MTTKHLGCGFTLGLVILLFGIALEYVVLRGGGVSAGDGIPLVFCAVGGILLAVFLSYAKFKQTKERDDDEKNKRLQQEAEERRRDADYRTNQENLGRHLSQLTALTSTALASIPEDLKSADQALDSAEKEFDEGVFAPFWDAIESAIGSLTSYDNGVRTVADNTSQYSKASKRLDSKPPALFPDTAAIPDATATVARLRTIVRRAQKIPDFAKIYEMRRTNSLLVAGFANLGSAIENMGVRINESISGLADTLDSAISSMSEQNAEYYRESLSAIEGVRDQLATDSEAQRQHATIVEERLDNIQRRRKPVPEKFRDGEY